MARDDHYSEPISYVIRYADTWRISVSKGYSSNVIINKKAKPKLVKAFREFAGRFYPELDDNKMPWTVHEQAGSIDSIVGAGEWPLGWYWQQALQALRDQSPLKGAKFKIRLSQMRQYTLLCVLKDSDQVERLLCPPVFGHDQRLSRGDQYLLYAAAFGTDITAEYDRIMKLPGKEQNDEIAYLLGRHDIEYLIKVDSVTDKEFCVKVKARFEPHPFRYCLDRKTLERKRFRDKVGNDVIVQNPYDVVQIPRFNNPDSSAEAAEILLTSESVCKAMERLCEVWNDPTCQAILLIADPGSGKEMYARSVYDFRDYSGASFCLVTLTADVGRNSMVLFAVPKKISRKQLVRKQTEVGAVLRARGGVLFVDEIDKVDPKKSQEVLSPLLRLLEAGDFIASGTPRFVSFESDSIPSKPPVYVFASSKPWDFVSSLKPKDFWTRISHVIKADHPFQTNPDLCKKIMADYVTIFWNQHIPKYLKTSKFYADGVQGRKKGALKKYYSDVAIFLLDTKVVCNLVKCIIEVMEVYFSKKKDPLPSIRDIRNLTRRSVYQIVQAVLTNEWIASTSQQLEYEAYLSKMLPAVRAKKNCVFEWVKSQLSNATFRDGIKKHLQIAIIGIEFTKP